MLDLAANDSVTVFVDGLLVHARVSGVKVGKTGLTIVRYSLVGAVNMQPIKLEDEGLIWVRGHVSEKDQIGAVLLVAGSLNKKSNIIEAFKRFTELVEDVVKGGS